MEREEILSKLNAVAKKDSQWLKDAKRRKRNWWWRKRWNIVHYKWLRIKRYLK